MATGTGRCHDHMKYGLCDMIYNKLSALRTLGYGSCFKRNILHVSVHCSGPSIDCTELTLFKTKLNVFGTLLPFLMKGSLGINL